MRFSVEVRDLSVRYGSTTAVDAIGFDLAPGMIHGLLGRNGSGKTSLLSVLAGFRRPSSGTVLVDGEEPFENARVMGGTCLVRESGDHLEVKVADMLHYVSAARPGWDAELAGRLSERFELPPRTKVQQLSRGKRSALGVVIGLASRAPLTIFNEAYLGLDAPSRYAFYDELLADYAEHPRTIILSSHLIGEVERLFERVLILDGGRLLIHEDADALRSRGVSVTGPADAVDRFVEARVVVGRQRLGRTVQATVFGELDERDRAEARGLGLDLGPVPVQDLFVHLTTTGEKP